MNYLELLGTGIGLVYLWLEYKASIYLWLASIVMPAVYIVVYYRTGLYADLGINVYYILASVYGWICWMLKQRKNDGRQTAALEKDIRPLPRRTILPLTAISAGLTVLFAILLIHLTDSNVPWADSLTTALSVVALWMLAQKYAEQWLVWMLADLICVVLYLYKGLYFTSGLYLLYTVIAYFGYLKWKKMIRQSN